VSVSIFLDSNHLIGNIIDFSIKSIAVRAKYSKRIETMHDKHVRIVFNIPNKKDEMGYIKLSIDVKIIFNTQADPDGFCKIVYDFDEENISESLLMEYVYDRQKELIIELKRVSLFRQF